MCKEDGGVDGEFEWESVSVRERVQKKYLTPSQSITPDYRRRRGGCGVVEQGNRKVFPGCVDMTCDS